MAQQSEPILGYSGFDVFEECYGYNENACFIADSEAAAHSFMQDAAFGSEYRIVPVTLSQIMDDYGCSLGEFAMEREAFGAFREAANGAGIRFATEPVDFCPELTLVNVKALRATTTSPQNPGRRSHYGSIAVAYSRVAPPLSMRLTGLWAVCKYDTLAQKQDDNTPAKNL